MALKWSGKEEWVDETVTFPGEDLNGGAVRVRATKDLLDEFGTRTIWQAAETKYHEGDYQCQGTHALIAVSEHDCRHEEADNPRENPGYPNL